MPRLLIGYLYLLKLFCEAPQLDDEKCQLQLRDITLQFAFAERLLRFEMGLPYFR